MQLVWTMFLNQTVQRTELSFPGGQRTGSAQPPEALRIRGPSEWGLAGLREASCGGDKCVWGGSIVKVAELFVLFLGSEVMQDPSG